jgi:hypothetical protein
MNWNFSEQKVVAILGRFCSQFGDLHVIETIKMNAMMIPVFGFSFLFLGGGFHDSFLALTLLMASDLESVLCNNFRTDSTWQRNRVKC